MSNRFRLLWSCEEVVLHHSASADGGDDFAFPAAEGKIVGLEVAVAGLYLLEEAALGALLIAEDFVRAYIIGEDSEKEAVLAGFAEESAEAIEVGAEERVGFDYGEVTGEVLVTALEGVELGQRDVTGLFFLDGFHVEIGLAKVLMDLQTDNIRKEIPITRLNINSLTNIWQFPFFAIIILKRR